MYKKILVPLDGSEFSECSLEHARAVAIGCKVPGVILLRVVEPIIADYRTGSVLEELLREAHEKLVADANNYLAKIAANLKKEGMAVETAAVEGEPSDKILDYARNNQVDLIIMSTHGRSGASRWAFGNVANRVLRHSTAPVLIAPPSGCRV